MASNFDPPPTAHCPADCPRLPDESAIGLDHRFVVANGVRLHCVVAGDGAPVLLLHGFPEFWYGWRRQIGPLAERFRVIVPDLRGYNLSDKPASGYELPQLATDVVGLIDAVGAERASVVGHDWGGVIAWAVAMWAPRRVERLVILNAPHIAAYVRELRRNPLQWLRSWYVGFIQVPGLPEWLLSRRGCQPIGQMIRLSSAKPEVFSEDDLAEYRRAMCRPGALRATLAYYRALRRVPPWRLVRRARPTDVPSLVIWGDRDAALVPQLADGLERWARNVRVRHVPEASHWIHHEQPELVNRLLLEFLSGSREPGVSRGEGVSP